MITMRQLEMLCAVIETGSITRASQRLNLSQPAVSKLIAALEAQTQLLLFRREHRRLVVTPEAHRLYAEAQRLLTGITDIARLAEEMRSLNSGTLSVASLFATGHRLVPEVLGRFLQERPAVNLAYQVRSSNKIMQWVVANQIDVGIAMTSIDHDSVESEILCSVNAVCALRPDHPLAARDKITADDLAGNRFISFGSEGRMQAIVDDTFDALNVKRRVIGRVYAIILCIDQGTADFGEGFQCVAHRVRLVGDSRLANALRSPVEPADDPVVGFDHGVGEHRLPFRRANGQNRKPPVFRKIAHAVGIIRHPSVRLLRWLRTAVRPATEGPAHHASVLLRPRPARLLRTGGYREEGPRRREGQTDLRDPR